MTEPWKKKDKGKGAAKKGQSKKKSPQQKPQDWQPDLRAALNPGSLARANMQAIRQCFGWITAKKGETFNNVVGCLILGFFAAVLLRNYTWLWWALGGAWVLWVGGVAVQHAPALEIPDEEETEGEEDEERWEADPENNHETAGEYGDEYDETEQRAEPKLLAAAYEARRTVFLKMVEETMATAFHNGTAEGKGVRIAVLLAVFHKKQHLLDWDEDRLKTFLESIGLPVKEQMYFKIAGKKSNKPGVHIDDLTKVLGHSPRLPAHLVPDLTPQHHPLAAPTAPPHAPPAPPHPPTLTVVHEEGEQGVA
ncbi:hypothetical protein ACFRR6_41855 [Streptomyces sp. NPDC056891]|uniref:hypothetical protein n=1 Tax=Streptomyces sp. NPDC056891 TaxID=3345961 RepID=UPI003674899F